MSKFLHENGFFEAQNSLPSQHLKNCSGYSLWEWNDTHLSLDSNQRKFVRNYNQYNEITKFQVSMNRNFIYEPKKGWSWHKSWILPTIIVNLELKGSQLDSLSDNFFVEVFAVIENENDISGLKKEIIDVGINGMSKMPIKRIRGSVNLEFKFNALKFDSTSYNSEKKKFYIFVMAYQMNEIAGINSILSSKISPPIYVDSRKTASDLSLKEDAYLKLYDPEMNEKIFYKKKMNTTSLKGPEIITNSLDGLISYYTAANIRNKVKHPFFIAIRFSECCSLYYNKEHINETSKKNVIQKIMKTLNDYEMPKKTIKKRKNNSNTSISLNNSNNMLILYIKSIDHNYLDKKIADLIGRFDSEIIQLAFKNDEIPNTYEKFNEIDNLKETYNEIFEIFSKNSRIKDTKEKVFNFSPLNMSQESEFLSLKKQKIEKTEVLLPKTKIETEDIRKIHPSSLPPSFFPQYPIPQQFPIDNQSTYDNFLKQIKDSNNNNFQYFPNNNNNDFNKHIRNFFEIFSAFQLSPFFNYNYDKFLCNQGFLFEQMKNTDAFKIKMNEFLGIKNDQK